MYGENKYGELKYGERDLKNVIDIENCTTDLLRYLPQNHQGDNVGKLLSIAEEELCISDYIVGEIRNQALVDEATFSLQNWETMLGVETKPQSSYEDRREIIKASLRGVGTTTKEMIKNTASSFSGGEVAVIEIPSEYRFIVQFISVKGIPRNMRSFIEMLETIKPAHLDYSFKYTYNVWNNINMFTWSELSSMTWDDLKVYDEGVIK